MPLPKPKPDESQDDFIARCMGDETANKEFPDEKQRAAVCHTAWREREKTVEGPFGFPLKEEIAKTVGDLLKTLPADCRAYRRKVLLDDKPELVDGERCDVSVITSGVLDRDNEVVIPDGIDWKQFEKSGMPVTFAHNYRELPVGRGLWVKRAKRNGLDGWIGKTQYAESPPGWRGDWFPDAVWHLVRGGLLKGKSIGLVPLEMRYATNEEMSMHPELKGATLIPKCIALEWAVAPIGANQDAVVEAVAKCKLSAPILKALGLEVKPTEPAKLIEVPRDQLTFKQIFEATQRELKNSLNPDLISQIVKESLERFRGKV